MCHSLIFFTKLLTSAILFSNVVGAKSVFFLTSPLVSGILLPASLYLFYKSNLSVLYLVFKTNPLISILFTLATNLSQTVF